MTSLLRQYGVTMGYLCTILIFKGRLDHDALKDETLEFTIDRLGRKVSDISKSLLEGLLTQVDGSQNYSTVRYAAYRLLKVFGANIPTLTSSDPEPSKRPIRPTG